MPQCHCPLCDVLLIAPGRAHGLNHPVGTFAECGGVWWLPSVLGIEALSQIAASLSPEFTRAGKRHVAGGAKSDFRWFAVPTIQKNPPASTIGRDREVETATIGMTPMLRNCRYCPSVEPVNTTRQYLYPFWVQARALARALSFTPDCAA